MTQLRRRRGDPDVVAAIENLLVLGWSPRRVLDRLEGDPEMATRLPSQRTVESMAAEVRIPRGKRWRVTDADPEEARLVLPVLGAVMTNSDGRIRSMTTATAAWVARVARMAPGLPPHRVYHYAVRYLAGQDGDGRLDLELAQDTAKHPAGG